MGPGRVGYNNYQEVRFWLSTPVYNSVDREWSDEFAACASIVIIHLIFLASSALHPTPSQTIRQIRSGRWLPPRSHCPSQYEFKLAAWSQAFRQCSPAPGFKLA
jgi:hypothetical protein